MSHIVEQTIKKPDGTRDTSRVDIIVNSMTWPQVESFLIKGLRAQEAKRQ